jgi:hypothetical protein
MTENSPTFSGINYTCTSYLISVIRESEKDADVTASLVVSLWEDIKITSSKCSLLRNATFVRFQLDLFVYVLIQQSSGQRLGRHEQRDIKNKVSKVKKKRQRAREDLKVSKRKSNTGD